MYITKNRVRNIQNAPIHCCLCATTKRERWPRTMLSLLTRRACVGNVLCFLCRAGAKTRANVLVLYVRWLMGFAILLCVCFFNLIWARVLVLGQSMPNAFYARFAQQPTDNALYTVCEIYRKIFTRNGAAWNGIACHRMGAKCMLWKCVIVPHLCSKSY